MTTPDERLAGGPGELTPASPHPVLDAGEQARLVHAIHTHGLHQHADHIVAQARPSLELKAEGVRDDAPLGTTRLGGAPDLPPGTPWPEVEGVALQFLAQIRFDALPIPERWPLPRAGMLSVFKGDDEDRFDVEHALVFTPSPEALVRTLAPAPVEDRQALLPCPATAGRGITVPGYGDDVFDAMELEDDQMDPYFALQEELVFARDASLLGLDFDVDERPTERRAIEVLDGRLYDYDWKHEHIDAVRREANRWVPLFQMDSSFTLGLNMWDAYTFVVLIRWEDLLVSRFDRTHAQLARR